MTKQRTNIIYVFVLCTAAVGILLLYFFVYPLYRQYFPKCLFHEFTGLYCLGCGSQRAFIALLHGDILTALHDNLLAVCFLPFIIYAFAIFFYNLFSPKKITTQLFNTFLSAKLILVLIIVFAIVRNIPAYPFTLLAPIG
jgi:hypothetical protein